MGIEVWAMGARLKDCGLQFYGDGASIFIWGLRGSGARTTAYEAYENVPGACLTIGKRGPARAACALPSSLTTFRCFSVFRNR
jgi:hypothetical protein